MSWVWWVLKGRRAPLGPLKGKGCPRVVLWEIVVWMYLPLELGYKWQIVDVSYLASGSVAIWLL